MRLPYTMNAATLVNGMLCCVTLRRVCGKDLSRRLPHLMRLIALPFSLQWTQVFHASRLYLSATGTHDLDIQNLSAAIRQGAFASLVELHLDQNCIGCEGMRALSAAMRPGGTLHSLRELVFCGNRIDDAGLKAFSSALIQGGLPWLVLLDLSSNQISDAGLHALSAAASQGALANLCHLLLDCNHISSNGLIALSAAIGSGRLVHLSELKVGYNHICESGLAALAASSRNLCRLTSLNMASNVIGAEGMRSLSGAIHAGQLSSLEVLFIPANGIGDEGVIAFTAALPSPSVNPPRVNPPRDVLESLTLLSLATNSISDVGMIALSEALGVGSLKSLEHLYIQRNQIGDAGLVAFSHVVTMESNRAARQLKTLDIFHNNIGDEGLIAFANAVSGQNNSSSTALPALLDLYLDQNFITSHGMQEFAATLSQGALPSLSTVVMKGNVGSGAPVLSVMQSRVTSPSCP